MKEKEIKVLMVEPGKTHKVTTIKNELESLQDAVSIGADERGLIEIITISEDVCILCNEEGKQPRALPGRPLLLPHGASRCGARNCFCRF